VSRDTAPGPDPPLRSAEDPSPPPAAAVRAGYARSFDALNEVVTGTKYDRYLRFFNFGYEPLAGEQPATALPRNLPNRSSANLLFQIVDDTDLGGAAVLEIGCGRGGNLGLLLDHRGVSRVAGLDVARSSVQFCRRTYPGDRAGFLQADAQAVPFADASFDAVLNVESSGCYPDITSFYCEVARVLRPGGRFLYADLFRRDLLPDLRRALLDLPFELLAERDITANVVAARTTRADRQRRAFGDGVPTSGFGEWVGAEGSTLHELLTDGSTGYFILRLRRRDEPLRAGAGALSAGTRRAIEDISRLGVELLGPAHGS
jgi:SAM-dependent methyltransferase